MSAFLPNAYLQFKPLNYRYILGIRIAGTSYKDAKNRIISWALSGDYRYVCVANVHMTMQAHDSKYFQKIVNEADLVTPDGMPLVLLLRILGLKNQSRVYGPTLMKHICEASARVGVSVGFYGSTPETLKALVHNLTARIPNLKVGYTYSPPFRALTPEEDEITVKEINVSNIKILFVGLGCPKQEQWMVAHHGRVKAVMIGVGAGFDFYAGTVKQAPKWMMRMGLEWLFRLCMEPKRLWPRYLYNNPRFLGLAALQLLKLK
ncbi:MAG: WecB/TagA/CpsF family glycosyltransferase, partial [Deltaproteobacteria bacterium]|nr:WecB/TagA/CpsF family glycosyltransferase [Deltaproteobacteria bacterium]